MISLIIKEKREVIPDVTAEHYKLVFCDSNRLEKQTGHKSERRGRSCGVCEKKRGVCFEMTQPA